MCRRTHKEQQEFQCHCRPSHGSDPSSDQESDGQVIFRAPEPQTVVWLGRSLEGILWMYLLECCLRQSVDLVSILSTSRPAARLDPVTLIRNADTMPMHFIHSLCQTVSGKDQHVEAFFARTDPQIQRGTINQNTHSNLRKRYLHVSHQHSCDQMFDLRSATLRTIAQQKKLSALHARMSSVHKCSHVARRGERTVEGGEKGTCSGRIVHTSRGRAYCTNSRRRRRKQR